MEKRELVIIGAGPAGLTAAIYGRRAGLDVLVLEKGLPGGQINITDEIENWPGVPHSTGADLALAFRRHAEKFSPEIRDCEVQGIDLEGGRKIVRTDGGEIEAQGLILASGASFRKLGCPGEAEFTGRGVSYCAVCDGAFFEDAEVAVIGGGNTAVEEASYLTQFASKVYIVHRRDSFRADKIPVDRALTDPKIQPVWNSVVQAIKGEEMVEALELKNVKTGEISDLPLEGVFIFVGTEPNVGFLEAEQLERAGGGWIRTSENMETSEEGVFAAGDVRDKKLRQVVTAAGDGAIAAMTAYEYISEQVHFSKQLFEPSDVVALFYSTINEEQMHLVQDVEAWSKETGRDLVLVDGYKNSRLSQKVGASDLPCLLHFSNGKVIRREACSSLEDVKNFF